MRRSTTRTMRWLLSLALMSGSTLLAQYSRDPLTCTGTGGSVGLNVYACDNSNLSSCTHSVSASSTVIAGEYIAYEATYGPNFGNCAYAHATSGTDASIT